MFNTRSVLALVASLSLIGGTPAVLADPSNGKGNPYGNQMDDGKADKDNKGSQSGPGSKGGGANQRGNGGDDRDSGSRINVGRARVTLGDNRGYQNPEPALPPGIQGNLMCGKPLPPDIVRKLGGRLLGRLPHYDGYEWTQAGIDLLLATVATRLIYEVPDNALD